MKKIALAASAALLCLTACQQKHEQAHTLTQYLDSRLAAATTFEDSLVTIDGSFIGGFTAIQAEAQVKQQGKEVDMNEVIRGIRDVVGVDTANISYVYGLTMGLEVLNVYKDLSATENITREQLLNTIVGAMRLDSLSQQQVMEMQPLFQEMFYKVQQRATERRDSLAMNTETARQNRLLADAVAEKLLNTPGFKAFGNEGIIGHVITPGDSALTDPNKRVNVAFRIYTIDGNQTIYESPARPMFVGRPSNEVVAAVLPYMSLGEEAEFFVPFKLAYGVQGNERLGVGACQSVMVKVTVTPE